jgi:hypothetical protein
MALPKRCSPRHDQDRQASATAQASRRIGGVGYRLRSARRRADYRSDLSFSSGDVDFALREARQVLQLLDRHGYQP